MCLCSTEALQHRSQRQKPSCSHSFYSCKCSRAPRRCCLMCRTVVFRIKVLYFGLCSSGLRRKTASFPTQSYNKSHYSVLGSQTAVILCHRQAPVNHENAGHSHFMMETSACVIGLLERKGFASQLRLGDPSN